MTTMITKRDIIQRIAALLEQPIERLSDDRLLTDLVTDSFVLVEMVIELQEAVGVQFGHDEVRDVHTVGDLVRLIERLSHREANEPAPRKLATEAR